MKKAANGVRDRKAANMKLCELYHKGKENARCLIKVLKK